MVSTGMSLSMSGSLPPPQGTLPTVSATPTAATIDARKQELLEARLAGAQQQHQQQLQQQLQQGSTSNGALSQPSTPQPPPPHNAITIAGALTPTGLHAVAAGTTTYIPIMEVSNSPVKNHYVLNLPLNNLNNLPLSLSDLQPAQTPQSSPVQIIAQPLLTAAAANAALNQAQQQAQLPSSAITPADTPTSTTQKDDSNVSVRSTSSHSAEKDVIIEIPNDYRNSASSSSVTQIPADVSTQQPKAEPRKRKRQTKVKETPAPHKGMKPDLTASSLTATIINSNGPVGRKMAEFYKNSQGAPISVSIGHARTSGPQSVTLQMTGSGSRSPLHLQQSNSYMNALSAAQLGTTVMSSAAGGPHRTTAASSASTSVACQTDLTTKEISALFTRQSMDKADKDKTIQSFELKISELQKEVVRLKHKLDTSDERLSKCVEMEKKLLIEKSSMEKKSARSKSVHNRMKLGQFVTQREGANFEEKFLDGYAFNELHKRTEELAAEKDELDRRRKALQKRKPTDKASRGKGAQNQNASVFAVNQSVVIAQAVQDNDAGAAGAAGLMGPPPFSQLSAVSTGTANGPNWNIDLIQPEARDWTWADYYQEDEILKLRTAQLKKDEQDCQSEMEKLERERLIHIRELKRIYNEDQSLFRHCPVLNKQYLLLSLIGKGGFSEVHKAFDLAEQRYVAVKIHQLIKEWKEEKKVNYIKHAVREYQIHKHLTHPRVVKLYDVFEIDNNSFATVLEYVEGNDLDFYLKQQKTIPEREARAIIGQVVSALKYFNELKPPIIHYDLKPGNILLGHGNASGEIKVTDFGLSKVCDDEHYDSDCGMDLTSQGAGTYWYLPPEVFETGGTPKISSKVDVWSVGVIFYQMLYGKKPYGDKQSQREVLQNSIILNAKEVEFSAKPTISLEAKNFIRRCLTLKKEERPDVLQLVNDEYLQLGTKLTKGSSSASSSLDRTVSALSSAYSIPGTPSGSAIPGASNIFLT
ncbi:serine/threonine-protein kinase tousled-like 2 isoform X2 [Paramacrobiotus metropolitanus]|uniref:serine/threonine-protein kinase tousled-like 2 isoform X2 n=1 Tax=Paramacrobiotus metropolitanus TaxID=2943436 RepID=UPI002445E84E|nr:serine/threonine-protein kinase tousled-like 2 isoform X2 [Paramacrobiotus metropolitanus]